MEEEDKYLALMVGCLVIISFIMGVLSGYSISLKSVDNAFTEAGVFLCQNTTIQKPTTLNYEKQFPTVINENYKIMANG